MKDVWKNPESKLQQKKGDKNLSTEKGLKKLPSGSTKGLPNPKPTRSK